MREGTCSECDWKGDLYDCSYCDKKDLCLDCVEKHEEKVKVNIGF